MFRRSLLAALVYVTGAIALLYWSVSGFFAGAPREDWALMIVLPAAWIISFWPMFGSLVMVYKIWTLQDTLERIGARVQATGAADETDLKELEDVGTKLAADESGLPEFVVRGFIRKFLARAGAGQAAADRPSAAATGT